MTYFCHYVTFCHVVNTLDEALDNKNFGLRKKAGPPATLASSAPRRTMIVNNRFRASHSVYNSWQHRRRYDGRALFTTAVVWRQVEHDAVLMVEHILYRYWNPKISPVSVWKIWVRQQNRRCQLPAVFHSNNGPTLLSFRDVTTGRTTDGPTTATIAYLAFKAGQQCEIGRLVTSRTHQSL